MSRSLYESKFLHKGTLKRMVRLYRYARRLFKDDDMAKRAACYATERFRQDSCANKEGTGYITSFTDWPSVTASVHTYDRLVNDRGAEGIGLAIPLGEAMARRSQAFAWEMDFALHNFTRVTGQAAEPWVVKQFLIKHSPQRTQWFKVRRGRDLFLPGMGSFNIAEAWRRLFIECEERQRYNPPDIREYCVYLPIIPQLQAVGYTLGEPFQEVEGFCGYGSISHLTQLIKRWPRWVAQHWRELRERRAQWDELLYPHPLDPKLNLQQNLQRAAERRERQRRNMRGEPQDDLYMGVADRYQPLPIDTVYETVFTEQVTPLGTIRPVTSVVELLRIGDELHNCAANYDRDLLRNDVEMVCLWVGDKPKVLGMLQRQRRRSRIWEPGEYITETQRQSKILSKVEWRYSQLYRACNQEPSGEEKGAFNRYLEQEQVRLGEREGREAIIAEVEETEV